MKRKNYFYYKTIILSILILIVYYLLNNINKPQHIYSSYPRLFIFNSIIDNNVSKDIKNLKLENYKPEKLKRFNKLYEILIPNYIDNKYLSQILNNLLYYDNEKINIFIFDNYNRLKNIDIIINNYIDYKEFNKSFIYRNDLELSIKWLICKKIDIISQIEKMNYFDMYYKISENEKHTQNNLFPVYADCYYYNSLKNKYYSSENYKYIIDNNSNKKYFWYYIKLFFIILFLVNILFIFIKKK